MAQQNFKRSYSLDNASGRFSGGERIRSWALVKSLLVAHSEYGEGMGGKLANESGPKGGDLKPVEEWLDGIYTLFNPDKLDIIDGRLAIWGLSRIDPALKDYLKTMGFLVPLETEIEKKVGPLDALLRTDGTPQPESEDEEIRETTEPGGEVEEPAAYRSPAPGYISDAIDAKAEDRLDIEGEVRTIAHVITSKRVKPPLSLGLFGDWGSGKSFFMGKLRDYIDRVAEHYMNEEKRTGRPAKWCSRVVQIEFNAWHYSDANLWASLVTQTYDALYDELSDKDESDKELKSRLEKKFQQAEGAVKQAEDVLDQATARVNATQEALFDTRKTLQKRQEELNGLIGNVGQLLQSNPDINKQLQEAAKQLGFPEAAKSYDALVELNTELQTLSGRLSVISSNIVRAPWNLAALALLVIVLPLAFVFVIDRYMVFLSPIGERVIELSTFLFGLISWLKIQAGRGMKLVQVIETGLQKAQEIRQKNIDENEVVQEAFKEFERAKAEAEVARENLQQALSDKQRLQVELEEMRPERKLIRLLEERSKSAAYSQHLGIISLIRKDFDEMSKLLVEMNEEERRLEEKRPPIQRIILYIDDLDRCQPEQVTEVLEAVHLLLAFPLFVVIVGVDPRWLRHSLISHYRHTLSENSQLVVQDGRTEPALYSSPQDYLEKIFQIPFSLRPVEQSGFRNLVADLLKPLPEPATRPPYPTGETRTQEDAAAMPGEDAGPAREPEPEETEAEENQKSAEKEPLKLLSENQLEFQEWEKTDIDRLWPMFRTPRSIKRFINIYRLMRASLPSEPAVKVFEGTAEEPGEYQLALLLLAVTTGFPNQATRFFHRMGAWLEDSPDDDAQSWRWEDILETLRQDSVDAPQNKNEIPLREEDGGGQSQAETLERMGEGGRRDRENSPPEERSQVDGGLPEDAAWEQMIECLEQVISQGFNRELNKPVIKKWAEKVARYSFFVHPI